MYMCMYKSLSLSIYIYIYIYIIYSAQNQYLEVAHAHDQQGLLRL